METNGNRFKCLTILFVPNDGLENMTSLQVLADELRGRGHKTIFTLNMTDQMMASDNELKDFGEVVTQTSVNNTNSESHFEYKVFELSEMEIFEKFSLKYLWEKLAQNKQRDDYYRKLIERTQPDILIIESLLCCPSLTESGVPWVSLNFGAPNQFLNDDRLPPAWSGLSFLSQRFVKHKWTDFRDKKNQLISELWHQLNDWCISRGGPKLPNNSLNKPSPYLNVYVYPRELDFNLGKLFPPKDWYRVNCLIKEDNDTVAQLQIPNDVLSLPGQLIYLEINCCANSDLNLMKRLIQLLSVSPNKFIVSKGPLHNRYDLPHNMWGLQTLPQKEAIKVSQLIISCGNTNTITEALFYGKPMIVMPLFGDHFDNSQRIKDNGFGVILHPYKCQLSTTLGSINALLFDQTLHRKLQNISYKMQNSDQIKTFCALIENLINK